MRLFVAIDLDEHARASLAGSIGALRNRLEAEGRVPARAVRWVDARHLHLTLHFLGEIDERRVPGIVSALDDPLPMAPFDLALGGWGVFPAHGEPRVVWVGVTAGASGLQTAHRLVGDRLAALGAAGEARPLAPHLTVGRVKDPAGAAWASALGDADPPAPVTCRVDRCTLYQSRLSPSGPTYLVQTHTRLHP
jgi:RNA 2',3'-cyclic 3'-phosphodiesterase